MNKPDQLSIRNVVIHSGGKSHPGIEMHSAFISAWKDLDELTQAEHKLQHSSTYQDYLDAVKYGSHIYNYRSAQA